MKIVSRAPARSASDDALVPLINIVFLLLIFFLLAGTIGPTPQFKVDPPTADSREPLRQESIELAISEEGDVYLAGERIPLDELAVRLGAAFDEARRTAGTRIRLDLLADQRLVAARLDPVLAALREAEIEDVYLKTRTRAP